MDNIREILKKIVDEAFDEALKEMSDGMSEETKKVAKSEGSGCLSSLLKVSERI